MDGGGFLLFTLLALCVLMGGARTAGLYVGRSPRRHRAAVLLGLGCILLGLWGRYLYQVFWVDEALWSAARDGDTRRVRALLRAGASPDYRWEDGSTALSEARRCGYREIVRLLQDAGAGE